MKNRLLAFICILGLSSNSVFANNICQENSLVLNGFSKHFEKKTKYAREYGYNEFNYGLGYKCRLDDWKDFQQELEIGYLKNSYKENSYYMSYNLLKPITPKFLIGLKASANSGYEILNKPHGISAGIVPTMQYKLNSNWATNFTIAPNFVFLNFQRNFND